MHNQELIEKLAKIVVDRWTLEDLVAFAIEQTIEYYDTLSPESLIAEINYVAPELLEDA